MNNSNLFYEFLINNIEVYLEMLKELNKQRQIAYAENLDIFRYDIDKNFKEIFRSKIIEDMSKRLDIPLEDVIILVDENINLIINFEFVSGLFISE